MVFISRYFIHEIFFVFLSLALVVAVVLYIERERAGPFAIGWMSLILFVSFLPAALNIGAALGGESSSAVWAFRIAFMAVEAVLVYFVMRMLLDWDGGRPIYLLLASACVSLLFATKETAFITLGTMLIACFCIWIWRPIALGNSFRRNWVRTAIIAHLVLLVVLGFFSDAVANGFRWLYNAFDGDAIRPAETGVFWTIIVLMAAAIAAWVMFLLRWKEAPDESGVTEPADLSWKGLKAAASDRTAVSYLLLGVVLTFVYLGVLFFSSFYTYFEGVVKAFEAYAIWAKTGSKDHTQNGFWAYLRWGMKVEAPLLIIGLLGAFIAMIKARHRVAMFCGLWAFGLLLAYSLIPYKTPWLALSFFLPMCLIAGYAINELVASRKTPLRLSGVALAILGSCLLAYQSYQHNFVRYDDEEMSYVYAHTRRGFMEMVDEIYHYSAKSGKGTDATVEIVSPDYWPLTWYLNDYRHANFHGSLIDANTAEMVVAKKDAQDSAVISRLSNHYKYVDVYPLRPGVNLILLVRKDLADSDTRDLYKILEYKPIPGRTN
jgi:uncharacterized protein (TIGR03663 family)